MIMIGGLRLCTFSNNYSPFLVFHQVKFPTSPRLHARVYSHLRNFCLKTARETSLTQSISVSNMFLTRCCAHLTACNLHAQRHKRSVFLFLLSFLCVLITLFATQVIFPLLTVFKMHGQICKLQKVRRNKWSKIKCSEKEIRIIEDHFNGTDSKHFSSSKHLRSLQPVSSSYRFGSYVKL